MRDNEDLKVLKAVKLTEAKVAARWQACALCGLGLLLLYAGLTSVSAPRRRRAHGPSLARQRSNGPRATKAVPATGNRELDRNGEGSPQRPAQPKHDAPCPVGAEGLLCRTPTSSFCGPPVVSASPCVAATVFVKLPSQRESCNLFRVH